MPEFLPVQTPTKPIFPDPQKPPGSNAPKLNLSRPKGIKPGTPMSPTRINPPPLRVPAAPVGAAGAAAGGGGIGILLPALALAIPQILLLDSPAAAPELMPPEPPQVVEPPNVPFKGGQMPGLYYTNWQYTGGNFEYRNSGVSGPIYAIQAVEESSGFGSPFDQQYSLYVTHFNPSDPPNAKRTKFFMGYSVYGKAKFLGIEPVPVNGQEVPDTGGDPPPTNTPTYSNPGNPIGTPQPQVPTAAPPLTGQPQGQPLAQLQQRTPRPAPAPTQTNQPLPQPQPIGQPQPLTFREFQPLPFADPAPPLGLNLAPPPAAEPTPAPVPTSTPNTNRSPAPFIPAAPFPPTILITPGGNPGPLIFTPNPSTGNPTPTPITSPTPERSPDPERPPLEDINRILGPMAIAIAGITALVQPNAIKNAARSATCEAFAPGGCNAPMAQDAANAANNSANNATALSGITAFLQALSTTFLQPIFAGVNLINTKLGPLMAGADGIGGFLSRLSKSLGIDRALNLIAIAANLHNAMMLSANLKITLLEMLSSIGNATGLLQTSEGENVDLNQVFNKSIENLLISILGAESYAGLKVGLRKYNAIYQAATNSLNAVSSMFNSLGNVVEQGAEYTGKIGNSLKGAGVVAENAYQWMAEKFDVKSNKFIKFESKIGDVTQVLETVNEIAQSVVEGQQAATEFQKANAEFIKAVEDTKKNPGIENKAIKEEAERAKASLVADPTGEDETGLLSFLTDF